MSDLRLFLKSNKKVKENTKYAATKSLCDKDGKPLEWTIKPLTTTESELIRDDCTVEVPVTGKPGVYRTKLLTSKYMASLIIKSVIEPDLNSSELQDSYGVKNPRDLIMAMIDDPGEYNAFAEFINEFNGFNESIEDKVDEAKNS
jgi:hypothetical protein